jgi:hypothetical protein
MERIKSKGVTFVNWEASANIQKCLAQQVAQVGVSISQKARAVAWHDLKAPRYFFMEYLRAIPCITRGLALIEGHDVHGLRYCAHCPGKVRAKAEHMWRHVGTVPETILLQRIRSANHIQSCANDLAASVAAAKQIIIQWEQHTTYEEEVWDPVTRKRTRKDAGLAVEEEEAKSGSQDHAHTSKQRKVLEPPRNTRKRLRTEAEGEIAQEGQVSRNSLQGKRKLAHVEGTAWEMIKVEKRQSQQVTLEEDVEGKTTQ